MLPRDERRRLREIEQQLAGDDPKLARRLSETSYWRRVWALLTPRIALAVVAAFLAVMCLFLGEGGGFFSASAVALVVFVSRDWQVRLD